MICSLPEMVSIFSINILVCSIAREKSFIMTAVYSSVIITSVLMRLQERLISLSRSNDSKNFLIAKNTMLLSYDFNREKKRDFIVRAISYCIMMNRNRELMWLLLIDREAVLALSLLLI